MRASALFALVVTGCAFEAPPASPPSPRYDTFESDVYPILMRDCGFPDCHGHEGRFFRVYGPGRHRLEGVDIDDPATEAEVRASYERARSMLASAIRAEDAVLLRKPLEIDRGGAPHLGIDEHGQDVFPSTEDERYQTILSWARSGFP
ncbi:MAG: hypothetical protein KC619_02865 [Myxococcales bacterium]|nr:hypothetical protein [Myxococcales bacterium]